MKRTILVAAVSAAPLLALAGFARAQLSISTSTSTPVATATAQGGAPADIDITSSGSIGVTVPGVAVTLNSNNKVTNEGTIGFTDISNATGILVQGGNTGSVVNSGTINITETYAPSDSNADGLIDGNFASGGNRSAITVTGASPFTGAISNLGVITVRGNASYGVYVAAPVTGDFQMVSVTPATGTTAATVTNGSINILGDKSAGFYVASSGGFGGNVRLASISASGVGAQAVVVNGAVGGGIDISGAEVATGYRTTTRSSNPALSVLYTAAEMTQGGPAVTIGGNVAHGLIISAPPLVLSATNADLDGNGVPDVSQGTGQVSSFGAAPALQVGVAGLNASLGAVGTGANSYGLIIQGSVTGNGLFDTITTPNLPGPVSATAIQLGAAAIAATPTTPAAPAATVVIAGGLHNTGSITAQAYQADATAIHILSGVTVPTIVNDGSIVAAVNQINTATTGVTPLNVNAILIEKGATVGSVVNNSGITANITGSGGVGGSLGGIIDRSGSLSSITNTGTISAQLTQSLAASLVPGTLTAIDLSSGVGPQSLIQSAPANASAPAYSVTLTYTAGQIVTENGIIYQALSASGLGVDPSTNPSIWRQVGATTPSISGSVLFGSGGTTLTVNSGTVSGAVIDLGAGVNTVTVAGDANTAVVGALRDGGNHTLTLNITTGTLSDTNPATIQANSVNVGANGVLLVAADPVNHTNTRFVTTGASTFAPGAQVGLTLSSLQSAASQQYVVVQTSGAGTLTAGTFGTGALDLSPFLYSVSASFVPASALQPAAEIVVTATQKTQAQLGFTNAEYSALNGVLTALPNNTAIQSAVLAQTTEAGLKGVYDQLLPSQGQGLFDALDRASQSVASLTSTTPDAGTRVAGSSLWLQEVNERVHRDGIQTQGSYSKLLGVIAGFERMGPLGGAVGVTLAYFNAEEAEKAQQVGGNVVASMVEGGGYYRRAVGGLTISARGAGGFSWFSGERRFVATGVSETATSSWNGYFVDGHVAAAYEQRFGRFYARPEISADYLRLHEGSHGESGGGTGFDLNIASRTSTRFSGQALLVLGAQFGKGQWLRSEIRAGYREVFAGEIGDTVANFAGGDPFALAADASKGGWATFGASLKSGSQYSYLALEGDVDFRSGEQRYDLRLAGRSIF